MTTAVVVEEIECPTIEELIAESEELIRELVKALYRSITKAADVSVIPKIYISKRMDTNDKASYLPGENLIILSAVNLQNKDVEYIAYVLAHEVWHHKQWEDGETFESYITPSADRAGYANQRVEQEANDFAESLFPGALTYMGGR